MVARSWLAGPHRIQPIPGVTAAGVGTSLVRENRDLTREIERGESEE